MITFEQIDFANLTEFDAMFDASLASLDANFFSQVPGMEAASVAEKKNYYRVQIESAIAGTWGLTSEGETLFFYKGVEKGITMEFAGGFIESDGITFRGHWYLTAPDDKNSRNSIYSGATGGQRLLFFNAHGLSRYKVLTILDSDLDKFIRLRINSGGLTLLSETQKPFNNTTHVTFHIEVT
jgi:hypothetical protein